MSYTGIFTDKNNADHPVTSTLYGTCATAANEAAKVVVCTDFDTLLTGVTIRVKFDNANTAASPTVNINSTGAKSVYRFGSTAPVDGDSWKAGEVVDLFYDGTSFFMVSADDIGSKQDALTFDDTPTDGSNNPVKSNGIYDALATKANTDMVAADFNAGTSYTAGNYCVQDGKLYKFKNNHSGAWSSADVDEVKITGELSALKSGFTALDNEVNGDATTYPYADVITIEDAVPSNLADCSVKIEPVQDLHGQSAPYVGGAGKNICPPFSTQTISDVTLTWDASTGTAVLNGTNNTGDYINFATLCEGTVAGTEYWLNGAPSDASDSTYYMYVQTKSYTNQKSDRGSGVSFNYNSDECRVFIRLAAGATANNVVFRPMICLNSETDKTFAPWENICPISGHTESVVTRAGKNLCEKTVRGYVDSINNKISINNDGETAIFYAIKGKTYMLSASSKDRRTIAHIDSDNVVDNMPLIEYTTIPTGVYTWTATWEGWTAWYFLSDASSEAESTIQIELGSTATPYEPYQGKTYTIQLGDTIYGGTVDFDSGVMTVDRAIIDLGTLTYTYESQYARFTSDIVVAMKAGEPRTLPLTCECYEVIDDGRPIQNVPDSSIYNRGGSGGVHIQDSRYTDPSDFATALDGMQLVYPLATPLTVQLTPQQIQLLKGTNTLTASTGQISVTVNGVSGSIGAVQEQVNEIAEEVNELAGDVDILNQNVCKSKYLISYSASNQKVKVGYTFGAQVFAIIGKSYTNSYDRPFCFIVVVVNGMVPGNERVMIKDTCGNYSSITATISNGYLEFKIGSYPCAMVLSSHDFTANYETIE